MLEVTSACPIGSAGVEDGAIGRLDAIPEAVGGFGLSVGDADDRSPYLARLPVLGRQLPAHNEHAAESRGTGTSACGGWRPVKWRRLGVGHSTRGATVWLSRLISQTMR